MVWCKFTLDNMKLFKSIKYNIDDNNILLKTIKNERTNIKNFFKTNKTYYKVEKVVEKVNDDMIKKDIINLSNEYFVDKLNVLNRLKKLHDTYKISWGNNNIIIQTTSMEFKSFESRIYILIGMIEYLRIKTHYNKSFSIYLALTNLEKTFPKNNIIMDVEHANSGYSDMNMNTIYIWRMEEFEKVLFHELMHLFDMDARHEKYDKHVDIDGMDRYYEALTDYYGIYYHIIYLSLVSRIKIKLLLELELGFIRNQANQLNDRLNLGNWVGKPNKKIKQKTASFAYYILKYLLFEYVCNKNEIIDNIKDYNKLYQELVSKGFIASKFIRIDSARMTLLQLK